MSIIVKESDSIIDMEKGGGTGSRYAHGTIKAITAVCKAGEHADVEPEQDAGEGNGGVKGGKREFPVLSTY